MRFFGLGGTPEEKAAQEAEQRRREEVARLAIQVREREVYRQRTDELALAGGGIPTQAVERLKAIGSVKSSGEAVLFSSDLDPDEAALLRRVGYRPLGMVTGSAMYHVGQAYASAFNDCEVTVLSEAYNHATQLAVSRLAQELKAIGAHGAVGMRLSLIRHEWADKTIEVQAIGTAVQGPGAAPTRPWMCDLAGQEWYALHRAGYDSAGLVWGHCTWFVLTTQNDEWAEQSWVNQEMTHWSGALSNARTLAMRHIHRQATELGAHGVAGVRIERRLDEIRLTGYDENPAYEREHHNVVMSIIGTAIRVRPGSSPTVRATTDVLSLLDGRLTPVGMGLGDLAVE